MCVILTIQPECPPADLPSRADLRRMAAANPDGLGLAWRRPSGAIVLRRGVPRVRDWIGTILSVARAGCPVVAHARIATIGGTRPALTHPWPVYAPGDARRERRIVAALAHNGHDAWWPQRLAAPALATAARDDRSHLHGLVSRDTRSPRDPWSDSRAYAVIASTLGLDAILAAPPAGQRLAVLTADALIETGHGWTPYRGSASVRVSNTAWQPWPWPRRDVGWTWAAWPADCATGAPRSADLYDRYGRLWPDRSGADAAAAAADDADAADPLADDRLVGWGIDDVTGAIGVTACRRGGVR